MDEKVFYLTGGQGSISSEGFVHEVASIRFLETGPIVFLMLPNRTRTAGILVLCNSPSTTNPNPPETRQARCGEVSSKSITLFGAEIVEYGVQHLCSSELTAFGSQPSFTALHSLDCYQVELRPKHGKVLSGADIHRQQMKPIAFHAHRTEGR